MMGAPLAAAWGLLWFGALPVWVLVVLAVAVVSAWATMTLAGPQPVYLRWSGADMWLFDRLEGASAEHYWWHGEGRRNRLYLRMPLTCAETGDRHDLMIWRDSVSDPSWRSLNAWFRIQASAVRREQKSTNV